MLILIHSNYMCALECVCTEHYNNKPIKKSWPNIKRTGDICFNSKYKGCLKYSRLNGAISVLCISFGNGNIFRAI